MLVPDLKRITTEFIEAEDRIRLTGEVEDGPALVLWLPQRLVNRLIPHLCQWLEQQQGATPFAEVKQLFAQQRAQAELEQQATVHADAQASSALVHSVDIKAVRAGVLLLYKDGGGQGLARLQLQAKPLRQWLGILHAQYLKGGWPNTVWPSWLTQAASTSNPIQRSKVLH